MKTLDTIFKTTLTVSHAMLIYALGSDWINTMISRHRRKKEEKLKKDLGEDFEDEDYSWCDESYNEPYIPALTPEALLHLKSDLIADFVQGKIFPEVPRTLSHMTLHERCMAELLLTSCIGLLLDTAPETERDFCVLFELLDSAVVPPDYEAPSATELLIEDSKENAGESDFYETFMQFKKECKDPAFVTRCCAEIASIIVVKLYGSIPAYAGHSGIMERDYDKGEEEYVKFQISGM